MSERLTGIVLPGSQHSGLADWGRKSASEMIEQIRASALHQKEAAEEILAAADDDFRVETYTGVYVHRNKEIIQAGRQKDAANVREGGTP